jgi:hypothetical protein
MSGRPLSLASRVSSRKHYLLDQADATFKARIHRNSASADAVLDKPSAPVIIDIVY